MASNLAIESTKFENGYILYDGELISNPHLDLFNPQWLQQHGEVQLVSHGRGEAWFVDYQNQHWVLRHYMRGGLVARVSKYHYLGWRLQNTRAWQEWQLTHLLFERGLPVPRPVAAQVSWPKGRVSGVYQAYLMVEKLPGAETLAQRLQRTELSESDWQKLGRLIARFHKQGVYHADLNANNILFDESDDLFLIDFDRGAIRKPGAWRKANLDRLHRSLLKLNGLHPVFHFKEADWEALLPAYSDSTSP